MIEGISREGAYNSDQGAGEPIYRQMRGESDHWGTPYRDPVLLSGEVHVWRVPPLI
jgi:hypothetical protein